MKTDSPLVQYFPQPACPSSNASHSRIYLTRRNNASLLPLHATPKEHGVKVQVGTSGTGHLLSNGMCALTDDEILALPDDSTSSEDKDLHSSPKATDRGDSRVHAKRKSKDTEVPASRKRSRITTKSLETNKVEQKWESKFNISEASFAIPSSDPFDWMNSSQNNRSQSSQGKKKANYGKQKTLPPSKTLPTRNTLPDIPDDISDGEGQRMLANNSTSAKFAWVSDIPPTPKKARGRPKPVLQTMLSDLELEQPVINFSMPDDDVGESNSCYGLLVKDTSTIGDHERLGRGRRRRSGSVGSSSSLSEVDSIVSLEMTQDQKEKLKKGLELSSSSCMPELPPDHIRCPVCAKPVNETNVPRFMIGRKPTKDPKPQRNRTFRHERPASQSQSQDPSKLPQQQQQDFCYQHSVHDAQITWTDRGYPAYNAIKWSDFEAQKLQPHLSFLRAIVYRKRPSHFLKLLEERIDSTSSLTTKANPTKRGSNNSCNTGGTKSRITKKYLTQDLVEIVKPGYYGARGAKLMAQYITESLAKPLKLATRSDRTIMDTGVSGFISAVLLPELSVRVVMSDFGWSTRDNHDTNGNDVFRAAEEEQERKARKILDESTYLGLLLCPDDDHVERDEDEDEN